MWVSRCVEGGQGGSCCGVDEGEFTTVVLYPPKRCRFDVVKKINLIESTGSKGTGWIAGSNDLIPVQSNSGPIDRTGLEP